MSGSTRRRSRAAGTDGSTPASQVGMTRAESWRAIVLLPDPLPAFASHVVETSTRFLGQTFNAPLVLQADTRPGSLQAIAASAVRLNVPLFTGDIAAIMDDASRLQAMRSVLEAAGNPATLVEIAGSALVRIFEEHANGGATLATALDILDADALAVRLDFSDPTLPVAADPTGVPQVLADAASSLHLPLLVSARSGAPRWTARALVERGVSGLIAGGASSGRQTRAGDAFEGWGIPAYASIRMLRGMGVPVISDGQVGNGLEAAKAIALGADLIAPLIVRAHEPSESRSTTESSGAGNVDAQIDRFLAELRSAMYLSGARNLAALKQAPFVATGETREWLEAAEMMWRADSGHN